MAGRGDPRPPQAGRRRHLGGDALRRPPALLKFAGCERELFPREAAGLIHEASAGAHRDIDRLATLALREAARKKRKLVERDLVRELLERQTRAA